MLKENKQAFQCETSLTSVYLCTLEIIRQPPWIRSQSSSTKGLLERGLHPKLSCSSKLHCKACRTSWYESSATFCKIQCGKSTELLWCTMCDPNLSSSLDISFIEGYKKKPHIGCGKFYLLPTRRFKNIFLEFGIYRKMFHFSASEIKFLLIPSECRSL